jgi:hypothetical protein
MANWAIQPGKLTTITLPENNRFVNAQQHRYLCIIISTVEGLMMTLDSRGQVSSQSKKR